jgi:hypothetical protein
MLKTANEVQVGDVIIYRAYSGENREVLVSSVSDDIKNGRAGFDGAIVGDSENLVWGYCSQIVRFISHKGE